MRLDAQSLSIGGRLVSALSPLFVSAEIGMNHGGSIDRALALARESRDFAETGVDGARRYRARFLVDDAVRLLTLPRTLTASDGEEIMVANGRYGPYIKKGAETRSLGSEEELFTLTVEQAEEILAKPKERRGRSQPATMAELGADPETGGTITLKSGRYGPYVTDGETNASIPKDLDPGSVTPELAAKLLADRRAAGPAKKTRRKRS